MGTTGRIWKRLKRVIAWAGQHIVGPVRWLNFLVRVGNLSKDSYYNQLTRIVMERVLKPGSVCVDAGCSRGEILRLMLKYAPGGQFVAFEPLPDHFARLVQEFRCENVRLYNVALSDTTGTSAFNYVVSNPAFSGLKKRPYDRPFEEDCQITVETDMLDRVLESAGIKRVDLIKIDVEGGELGVLKGAASCIAGSRPVIIFEHGAAAAGAYGATPEEVYALLCDQCGLKIWLMQDWLLGRPALTPAAFCQHVYGRTQYYFMAR